MSVTLGVVTVLYNSESVLEGFFRSLAIQKNVAFKLYVIDNSRTPIGANLAKELAVRYGIACEVVFNNRNFGVAKGNNDGIKLALRDKCEYILLANNDTEFECNTFASLLEPLICEGEVASTCQIAFFDEPDRLWFERGAIYPVRALTPHLGARQRTVGDMRYTSYAPTCFLMLSARVFSVVGLMDEDYFVYYDDSDFVWRMRKAHMRIRLIGRKMVLHKVSSSTGGESSEFSVYYMHRNRIKFARKHNKMPVRLLSLVYIYMTRLYRIRSLPKKLRMAAYRGLIDGLRA